MRRRYDRGYGVWGWVIVGFVVVGILYSVVLFNMCGEKGGRVALSLFSNSGWACVDDQDRQIVVP